jgi:hypothetical protein
MKRKGCLLFIFIFVVFAIIIVLRLLRKSDDYNSPYYKKIRTGVLGKISFKGKVINSVALNFYYFLQMHQHLSSMEPSKN